MRIAAAIVLLLFATVALAEDGLKNPGAQRLWGAAQNPGTLGGGGGPTGCASGAIGGLLNMTQQCVYPALGGSP